jgi:hypothetical protein
MRMQDLRCEGLSKAREFVSPPSVTLGHIEVRTRSDASTRIDGVQSPEDNVYAVSTKRQVVEDSLRLLIQVKKQERIREARGKLTWLGDLNSLRRD